MVDIITTCIIIFGGGTALLGLKYLLFKCEKEQHDQLILVEEEQLPPKYEDIVNS